MTTAAVAMFTELFGPPPRVMFPRPTIGDPSPCPPPTTGKEESSKSRIDRQIKDLLGRFAVAFKKTFEAQFEKGDIILRVEELATQRDGKRPTLKGLRNRYFGKHSLSYLCKLRSTAAAFSASDRAKVCEAGASFTDCYTAMDLCRRMIAKRHIPRSTSPVDLVERVRTSAKKSSRAIAKETAIKIKRLRDLKRMDEYRRVVKNNAEGWWKTQFLRADCRSLLGSVVKQGSVDLCWFDPPYLYPNGGRAAPCLSDCGLSEEADNTSYKDAIKLQVEMIRALPQYLSEHGVIILWGAGGVPDNPHVVQAVYESGFEYVFPLYWGKRPQAGCQYRGFSTSSERVLIIAKKREDLFDNNPELPRGQRVSMLEDAFSERMKAGAIKAVTHGFSKELRSGAMEPGDRSVYEKPIDLCAGFLEKLTKPGDLVWDCCGCTGVMVEACLKLGRRWLYSESHEQNYALGFERIGRLLAEHPDLVA